MADNIKPEYVHEEISYLGQDNQSQKVSARVCELIKLRYRVKVIEHEPVEMKNVGTAYRTTIMATLTDLVDISN